MDTDFSSYDLELSMSDYKLTHYKECSITQFGKNQQSYAMIHTVFM